MLRAVRIAAETDFNIEGWTLTGIRNMAPRVQLLSADRRRYELERTLNADKDPMLRLTLELGLLEDKVDGVPELLESVAGEYDGLADFNLQSTHDVLAAKAEFSGMGMGAMVHPVRVAVSGLTEGPGLFEMLTLIGRDRVCARLRRVAAKLRDGTL